MPERRISFHARLRREISNWWMASCRPICVRESIVLSDTMGKAHQIQLMAILCGRCAENWLHRKADQSAGCTSERNDHWRYQEMLLDFLEKCRQEHPQCGNHTGADYSCR